MTKAELREKIRLLVPTVVGNKKQAEAAAVEYDELTKFPELKAVIVDLLTHEFDNFIASIDWVAPKPTTFRINLKNDQDFYLINLPEEERATEAIARLLRYGSASSGEAADTDSGGSEDVDVDVEVDDTTDVEV